MAKNPSGLSLLKQKNPLGKNQTDPTQTDKFINKAQQESREGTPPPEGDIKIITYKGERYTINREGEFKSLNGKPMKWFFHPKKRGPRIRVHRTREKNGKIEHIESEIWLLKIMKDKFWPYLEGYRFYALKKKDYILIPKDGNYDNMHYSNLKFVNKKEWKLIGTKKKQISLLLQLNPNVELTEIRDKFNTSDAQVRRVANELISEGNWERGARRKKLQKDLGITISICNVEIYEALLACDGKKDNLKIAQELWPEKTKLAQTNQEKKLLTAPIVRAKKKLIDLGRLTENTLQTSKKELIELLTKKHESWLTHQQIADQLGLTKQQVDNFSRQFKKNWNSI